MKLRIVRSQEDIERSVGGGVHVRQSSSQQQHRGKQGLLRGELIKRRFDYRVIERRLANRIELDTRRDYTCTKMKALLNNRPKIN